MQYLQTEDQFADFFTKFIQGPRNQKLRHAIGVKELF